MRRLSLVVRWRLLSVKQAPAFPAQLLQLLPLFSAVAIKLAVGLSSVDPRTQSGRREQGLPNLDPRDGSQLQSAA